MTNTATKNFYLTIEKFDADLQDCLIIITEPTEKKPYYVCQHTSASLYTKIVHIYIVK